MCYLTVHSMLHLLGYDHMNKEEKNKMRAKEKEIMKKLKIFK
jgi:probable rRNA maturation factor